MPELPEVEVLRRSLEPNLIGRRVIGIAVANPGLREPVSPTQLDKRLRGRRIVSLGRRAKYLLVHMADGHTLVVHLGMSGSLLLLQQRAAPQDHEHVSIDLDGGQRLAFVDPRRFGLVLALPTHALDSDRHFRSLGIEPLEEEFSGGALRELAHRRRGPVKSFLMNGDLVVGVGNIYASEALFQAGIHPNRSVSRISAARWDRLAAAVRSVLSEAIAEGGTTLSDFRDGKGQQGYFQVSLAVYGRDGEACERCGGVVRRATHSGRSTFYCAGCQH